MEGIQEKRKGVDVGEKNGITGEGRGKQERIEQRVVYGVEC